MYSWVSTTVLTVNGKRFCRVKCSNEAFEVFYTKVPWKEVTAFCITCNLGLNFSRVWLCTDITSCGTVGKKKLKSEPSCLAVFNPTLLLAAGEQLLVLSSTHDFPTFFLNTFLEIFPAVAILVDVGVWSSISRGHFIFLWVPKGFPTCLNGWRMELAYPKPCIF